MNSWSSSFYDMLVAEHPNLLTQFKLESGIRSVEERGKLTNVPHGTTVLALKYKDGVIIAGDRMATEGYQVSARRIEKVYRCDDYSAIAISGAAGVCIEMARLLQVELEHYEKIEGVQGLVVIPIFAGYDVNKGEGRIYKYDITGGKYEETEYHSTGSGGKDARTTLKKLYSPDLSEDKAVMIALEALYDAAEEDIGTGGPDMVRGIFPIVKVINKSGITDIEQAQIEASYRQLINSRRKAIAKEK